MEYVWHREDTGNGPNWQLQQCRVAPTFPGEEQPAGLVHKLRLQQLEDVRGCLGLPQFMLWANNERTTASQGFRWLTQYAEKLAVRHELPITPLGLRPSGDHPFMTLEEASIIAHGHRSLVLALRPNADYVVKVGKTSNIRTECHIQSIVDTADCQHLRKAVPGFNGIVEGAGPGLSFVGLQHCCQGSIQAHHLASDEAKISYINQARAWLTCCYFL